MTFIRAQAEALCQFVPYYISAQRAPGLELPEERVVAINCSAGKIAKIREVPFKVFGYDPIFFRRVRKIRPALLHAHFGPGGLTALPLAQWLGIPLITTFHGYDASVTRAHARRSNYRHRVYWRRQDVLKREAQLFIAVSEFIKGLLLEQGFPEEKVVVHYIGVDTGIFQPRNNAAREPVVLFVGRLVEKKGCEYLIRAMEEVQALRPDAELIVIGDGPLRAALAAQAKTRLQRYRFLGMQPLDALRDWMNRASVFSVPSVRAQSGDREGFGIVFAEAQAMGLPVASFASGGIPEAVAHGCTGLLAPERDWRALAQNILLLLGNQDLWRRMSEAGPPRIAKFFNLHTQTRKLEELYWQSVDGTPSRLPAAIV
jgi:glycosyltransferase involved in cell wall biosynthesis